MFLSVTEVLILVTRWQHVSIHSEVLGVCVTLGSLEMDLHAQVIYITCSKPPPPLLYPVCKYEGLWDIVTLMSCKIRPTEGTHTECIQWAKSAQQKYRFQSLNRHLSILVFLTFITIAHGNFSLLYHLHINILENILGGRGLWTVLLQICLECNLQNPSRSTDTCMCPLHTSAFPPPRKIPVLNPV